MVKNDREQSRMDMLMTILFRLYVRQWHFIKEYPLYNKEDILQLLREPIYCATHNTSC